MKTQMSRFHIHDDESAPEGSLPILKGALGASGQLPNFIGVLAGSPAALRAYARFRSELRHGTLPRKTLERISLAVAEHYGSVPGIELHQRTARLEGLGLDEVQAARGWDSSDEAEQSLLLLLRESLAGASPLPAHLVEEAREHGWTDEQILEGDRVRGARELHGDGQRGRRRAGRRLPRGVADAARRLDPLGPVSNPERPGWYTVAKAIVPPMRQAALQWPKTSPPPLPTSRRSSRSTRSGSSGSGSPTSSAS